MKKLIKIPFTITVKWKCPKCGKNRQQNFRRIPRRYSFTSKVEMCDCGCPSLEFGEDFLYGSFIIRVKERKDEKTD